MDVGQADSVARLGHRAFIPMPEGRGTQPDSLVEAKRGRGNSAWPLLRSAASLRRCDARAHRTLRALRAVTGLCFGALGGRAVVAWHRLRRATLCAQTLLACFQLNQ